MEIGMNLQYCYAIIISPFTENSNVLNGYTFVSLPYQGYMQCVYFEMFIMFKLIKMSKMIFSKILIRIVASQLVFNEYDSFSYHLFKCITMLCTVYQNRY